MGGKSTQQGQTYQQTDPWKQAIPSLQGILGGVQSQMGNYNITPKETNAANTMAANAQGITNQFSGPTEDLTNKFMTGDPTGLLGSSLNTYNTAMAPYANIDTNPFTNPAMAAMLTNNANDIQKRINGEFAGSGRDLSGINQEMLARGISEGNTPTLFNQYNLNNQTKLGAIANMFGAAGNSAAARTSNMAGAPSFIDALSQVRNAGGQGVLSAEALKRNIPLQGLGMLANLTVPIAGLGGNQNGAFNTTNQMSGAQQFATIASGIQKLFPNPGATAGNAVGALGSFGA